MHVYAYQEYSVTIKNRLQLGFGIVLSLMVLIAIIGINEVSKIDRTMSKINEVDTVKQRAAINFRGRTILCRISYQPGSNGQ